MVAEALTLYGDDSGFPLASLAVLGRPTHSRGGRHHRIAQTGDCLVVRNRLGQLGHHEVVGGHAAAIHKDVPGSRHHADREVATAVGRRLKLGVAAVLQLRIHRHPGQRAAVLRHGPAEMGGGLQRREVEGLVAGHVQRGLHEARRAAVGAVHVDGPGAVDQRQPVAAATVQIGTDVVLQAVDRGRGVDVVGGGERTAIRVPDSSVDRGSGGHHRVGQAGNRLVAGHRLGQLRPDQIGLLGGGAVEGNIPGARRNAEAEISRGARGRLNVAAAILGLGVDDRPHQRTAVLRGVARKE